MQMIADHAAIILLVQFAIKTNIMHAEIACLNTAVKVYKCVNTLLSSTTFNAHGEKVLLLE